MPRLLSSIPVTLAFGLSLALIGCGGGDKPKTDGKTKDHVHAKDDKHDHDHDHKDKDKHEGHSGEVIALGEGAFGPFKIKASRDKAEIKPGGDAPVDVWVDAASPTAPKVAAVRFWIGAQDAKGSVKAKAEIEDPKEPNRWHVHVEVPAPLPAGAKLWVEIEDDKGATTVGSFDLKG